MSVFPHTDQDTSEPTGPAPRSSSAHMPECRCRECRPDFRSVFAIERTCPACGMAAVVEDVCGVCGCRKSGFDRYACSVGVDEAGDES